MPSARPVSCRVSAGCLRRGVDAWGRGGPHRYGTHRVSSALGPARPACHRSQASTVDLVGSRVSLDVGRISSGSMAGCRGHQEMAFPEPLCAALLAGVGFLNRGSVQLPWKLPKRPLGKANPRLGGHTGSWAEPGRRRCVWWACGGEDVEPLLKHQLWGREEKTGAYGPHGLWGDGCYCCDEGWWWSVSENLLAQFCWRTWGGRR